MSEHTRMGKRLGVRVPRLLGACAGLARFGFVCARSGQRVLVDHAALFGAGVALQGVLQPQRRAAASYFHPAAAAVSHPTHPHPAPGRSEGGGWRQNDKPLFDVQSLAYKLKGNNVPMPSTLVRHLLRVFIPELIQVRNQIDSSGIEMDTAQGRGGWSPGWPLEGAVAAQAGSAGSAGSAAQGPRSPLGAALHALRCTRCAAHALRCTRRLLVHPAAPPAAAATQGVWRLHAGG